MFRWPDSLIFCLYVLWVDLGSSCCLFQFLIKGHNNFVCFFRCLYFPQVPCSHADGELAIPITHLLSSMPATNLKYSISIACSHDWTNQLENCNHNLFFPWLFKLMNYQLNFWIQIFTLPNKMKTPYWLCNIFGCFLYVMVQFELITNKFSN